MSRIATVAAAQMGPIEKDEPRQSTVARMISMMRQAKERGADLIVYPELALTTFFPRYWMENEADVDAFFEKEMPSLASLSRRRHRRPLHFPSSSAERTWSARVLDRRSDPPLVLSLGAS